MRAPLRINFFVQFVHEQGTYFRFHDLGRALIALGQDVTVYASDNDRRSKSRYGIRDGVNYVLSTEDLLRPARLETFQLVLRIGYSSCVEAAQISLITSANA